MSLVRYSVDWLDKADYQHLDLFKTIGQPTPRPRIRYVQLQIDRVPFASGAMALDPPMLSSAQPMKLPQLID